MTRTQRFRWTLGIAVLSAALAAGVGLAASVGITSEHLTVHTSAVVISPTTCTLSAADADSYVSESSLLTNVGAATNLDIRSALLDNKRTFVQFSLAPCSIPANSLVTAASLELFMFTAPAAGRTYDAHRVTASWTEMGITWANQPAAAALATASIATGTTSNVTLAWDVAADVQAFVDGTANNGWQVKDRTESSLTSRESQFRAAEHGAAAERPVLSITYYP